MLLFDTSANLTCKIKTRSLRLGINNPLFSGVISRLFNIWGIYYPNKKNLNLLILPTTLNIITDSPCTFGLQICHSALLRETAGLC